MKSVYITRMIPQETIDELRRHFEVEVNLEDRALTKEELKRKVKGRDAVLSLLTDTIDAEVLDAAGPQCRSAASSPTTPSATTISTSPRRPSATSS